MEAVVVPEPFAVWLVDLDATVGRVDVLDDHERARAARFATDELRRRYVATWTAARRLLAAELGVEPAAVALARHCARCGDRTHGKPSVAGDPIRFNVSHTATRALVAIGPVPVGVDLEDLQPIRERATRAEAIDHIALHVEERGLLDGLGAGDDRAARLLQLWVRKEAAVKATGHGLTVPPASVNVAAGPGAGTHVEGTPVQYVDLRVDDGVAALAWTR